MATPFTAQLLLYTQPGSLRLLHPSSLDVMAGKMTFYMYCKVHVQVLKS